MCCAGARRAMKSNMARKRTLLICDDDGTFCLEVARVLTDAGWEVIAEVGVATAAIAVARSVHPEVVLLDANLPGLPGVEAIPAIVEAGAAVVICSALGPGDGSALRAGASAVVDKADVAALPEVLASIFQPA